MQALILRVLVVDDSDIGAASAKLFKHKLILRSSVKLRTEPMLSVKCVSIDRMSWCLTSRCQ